MSQQPRMDRATYKKQKEIEEARKAGTLAPAVDKNGNMINPHMPEYMSKVPWYVKQEEVCIDPFTLLFSFFLLFDGWIHSCVD